MNLGLRFFWAYAATLLVMVVLDGLWLGLVARSTYQAGIGPLMADPPRWGAAALFYLAYPLGLMVFAVWPSAATPGWAPVALLGAGLGLMAYGTYDLTNLATLRGWPLGLSLLDMAWGTVVSASSSVAGKILLDRLPPPG